MKNFKIKLVAVLSACLLFGGLGVAPVVGFAEETNAPVESVESVETSVETPEEEQTEETPTEEPTVENSEVSEPVEEEKTEEETSAPVENHTFENFLAWTEQEAERYGYGEQYKQALEAIKTAATEKQITISTLCSLGLMAAVVCYIIYKKVTDAKFKKAVIELLETFDNLKDKTNELVKGTNDNSTLEEKNGEEIRNVKKKSHATMTSVYYLTEAFMNFVEGVDMKDTKKQYVLRKCNAALKEIDGEVSRNEDNEG